MSQDLSTTPRRLSKAARWVIGLSCANLVALCVVISALSGLGILVGGDRLDLRTSNAVSDSQSS